MCTLFDLQKSWSSKSYFVVEKIERRVDVILIIESLYFLVLIILSFQVHLGGGGGNLLERDRRNKKFSSWRTVHLRVQRVQGDFRSASANIDTVDMQVHTRVCTPFWPRVSPRDWSPIRATSRILMWENTIPTRWMPSCVRCWLFQDVVY